MMIKSAGAGLAPAHHARGIKIAVFQLCLIAKNERSRAIIRAGASPAPTVFFALFMQLCLSASAQEPALNETFAFRENARIQYDSTNADQWRDFKVIPGDKTVFYWQSDNHGDPGNDSECPAMLVFSIPADADHFLLEGKQISTNGGLYAQLCLSADRGWSVIANGKISGQRSVTGFWEVDINVNLSGHRSGKVYSFFFQRTFLKAE